MMFSGTGEPLIPEGGSFRSFLKSRISLCSPAQASVTPAFRNQPQSNEQEEEEEQKQR